jgi:glycosyltransferase involved in cell wall biosynthesis
MERRSINPWHEARLLWRLWRLLGREKPDIVHGLTIKCAVYGSIAAHLAGIGARVNAVNGLGYVFTSSDLLARVLRPQVRLLMQLAFGGKRTRLVVQNPDDWRVFECARLVAPERIRLIPGSGVDSRRFAPKEGIRQNSGPFRVLLPARLLWDKGVGEFVEAARRLQNGGVEFLAAGEADPGNPAAVPAADIALWQQRGLVAFLGHVDDMPGLFHSVDVVALPSYREGLPKALIEAAACGLPLIAADVPGCREVVTHEVDGLLVPVRNADALASAIARLRDDPALARRLGKAARAKAVDFYDERRIVAQTLDVYAEIV